MTPSHHTVKIKKILKGHERTGVLFLRYFMCTMIFVSWLQSTLFIFQECIKNNMELQLKKMSAFKLRLYFFIQNVKIEHPSQ